VALRLLSQCRNLDRFRHKQAAARAKTIGEFRQAFQCPKPVEITGSIFIV
jgi:hypothetical protein